MEDKINKIWYQMNMKEITSEEARHQVLGLFTVMQRSELLLQAYKEGFDAATSSLIEANKVVQERKLQQYGTTELG